VETIGSKRSYALTWCMPNNDDDDDANIRVGSSWRGPQMRVGLSTTAIFADLSGTGYFSRNFRDEASILYGDMRPLVGM